MSRPAPDIRRGRLSPEEEAAIETMAGRGQKPGQVALTLNRHSSTIHFAFVRLGLKAPVPRTFSYLRNGRPVVSFSADEDAFLEALRCQNYTVTHIAAATSRRFGKARTAATVRVRLTMLANKAEHA